MRTNNSFHYIKHNNIDWEKWNQCLDKAINCRVYAYDWHLDRTAVVWDALVWGDYEYIMPLPVRRKFGIKYIYQPLFSQQLGIFPSPPQKVTEAFTGFIQENFKYCDLHLNSENFSLEGRPETSFSARNNYLLSLDKDWETLQSNFSKNTKRNLTKAEKNSLSITEGIRLEKYLEFKRKNLAAPISKSDFTTLQSLIAYGQRKGFGQIYGVYSEQNELCAAVYFCKWKNRLIYFNAVSSQLGKELGAMNLLVSKVIHDFAGSNMLLDFEGSMIPGVARFYKGFGAKPETYFQLKINRLPLLLRWIKR